MQGEIWGVTTHGYSIGKVYSAQHEASLSKTKRVKTNAVCYIIQYIHTSYTLTHRFHVEVWGCFSDFLESESFKNIFSHSFVVKSVNLSFSLNPQYDSQTQTAAGT